VTFARGETSLILAVVTLIVMVLVGLITTCAAFARNVQQDRAPTRSFREFLNGEVDVETGRICGRVAFREIATMPFMVAEYDDTSSVSHVALAKSQTKAHWVAVKREIAQRMDESQWPGPWRYWDVPSHRKSRPPTGKRAGVNFIPRRRSGLKANKMHKLLPLIAIFVMFTHLNGEPVAVNPESVSSVHPTPPGYAVGTMIDVQNGSEIVKESFAEVVKKLNETGSHGPDRWARNTDTATFDRLSAVDYRNEQDRGAKIQTFRSRN
jgi:uncharacterized protein YlzI (FlbEa/FlbD family)